MKRRSIAASMVLHAQAVAIATAEGDWTEALYRAGVVQHVARLGGFEHIENEAAGLVHALRRMSQGRPSGATISLERLTRTLNQQLDGGTPDVG